MPVEVNIANVGNIPAETGNGSQLHIIYASAAKLWLAFYIWTTNTAFLRCATSPDLINWSANNNITLVNNHSSEGRNFSVCYDNIAGVDVVHVAEMDVGTSTIYHARGTVSGSTVTWGTMTAVVVGGASSPSGLTIALDANNVPVITYCAGTAVNTVVAYNADMGTNWTDGWNSAVTIDTMSFNVHSTATIPLSATKNLAIFDNGAGSNFFTRLRSSVGINYVWPASSAATTAVTAALPADWGWAITSDGKVHVVILEGTSTLTHYTFDGVSWDAGQAITTSITVGTDTGVGLSTNGTDLWAFVISSATGNDIYSNHWTAGTWGGWTAFGLGATTRTKVGCYNRVSAATIGVYWTEGPSSPFLFQSYAFAATAVVPNAPTGVTAMPMNGGAVVQWTPPSDGGGTITSYTVTATPGGATSVVTAAVASTATILGLTNGTTYTFTVHATNSAGSSTESSSSPNCTPYLFIGGTSVNGGFGGRYWGSTDAGSPAAYIWGYIGNDATGILDLWRKRGQYEAQGRPTGPNPPFPLITGTTVTGDITTDTAISVSTVVTSDVTSTVDPTTTITSDVTSTVDSTTTGTSDVTSTVDPTTTNTSDVTSTVDPTTTNTSDVTSTVDPTTTVASDVTSTVDPTTTNTSDVASTVDPTITNTTDVTSTVDPTTTVASDVTSTVDPTTTNTSDVTSTVDPTITDTTDVTSAAAVTMTITTDVTTTIITTRTVTTDVTSDAATTTIVVSDTSTSSAITITATSNVTTDAATTTINTLDATSTAVLVATVTTNITTDALITTTITSDVSTDATITIAVTANVTSDAAIAMTVVSDALADAAITTTDSFDVPTDAAITMQPFADETTDASIDTTDTADISTDAAITTVRTGDTSADAAITQSGVSEVTSDAAINVTFTPHADLGVTAATTATVTSDVASTVATIQIVTTDIVPDAAIWTFGQTDVSADATLSVVVSDDVLTSAATTAVVLADALLSLVAEVTANLALSTSAAIAEQLQADLGTDLAVWLGGAVDVNTSTATTAPVIQDLTASAAIQGAARQNEDLSTFGVVFIPNAIRLSPSNAYLTMVDKETAVRLLDSLSRVVIPRSDTGFKL